MRLFALSLVVIAWSLASTRAAHAGTITAKLTGISNYSNIEVTVTGGTNYQSVLAGPLTWRRTGGTYAGAGPAVGDNFFTFCTEVTQNVNYGTHTYDVVNLEQVPGSLNGMGTQKALKILQLWDQHRDEVVNSNTGAAFQLAVWEIVNDDDNSLSLGSFQARYASQTIPTIAQGWLDGLSSFPGLQLGGMSNPNVQDQVFFQTSALAAQAPAAVPLPSAAWAGGFLLLALVLRRIYTSKQR